MGAGAFLVAAVPLLGRRSLRLVRRHAPVMGTIAELGVLHRDERFAHAAISAALDELRWVERAMTRFRTDSDVGRVNAAAGAPEPVVVADPTARVVEEGLRWARASSGAFDPCVGRAVALWDVARRTEPPPLPERRALANRKLYRSVEVDRWRGNAVLRLSEPDGALDLGGIAKGYGVDRAVDVLRGWGIASGLVNVGGDLYALGRGPEGVPWRVGVRDPQRSDGIREAFDIEDAAVATSGDYEEFFTYGGERFHHILDPSTGAPRRSATRSVTVSSGCCMAADAAATSLFGMGRGEGEAVVRRLEPGSRIL